MVHEPLAYFAATAEPDLFDPLNLITSGWDAGQMPGPAITGLLTRGALGKARDLELDAVLVRAAYELHTVARLQPTRVRTEIVKRGRRVTLIDVVLVQGDREVARAHVYFATATGRADGELWHPESQILPPDRGLRVNKSHQLYFSESTGWTNDATSISGDARKAVWIEGLELVRGEPITGALLAGYAADVTSATVNWGTSGVAHINIDATLSLSRHPVGSGIGLYSTFVSEGSGLTAGSALVFDREGPLGVATASGIAQAVSVNPVKW